MGRTEVSCGYICNTSAESARRWVPAAEAFARDVVSNGRSRRETTSALELMSDLQRCSFVLLAFIESLHQCHVHSETAKVPFLGG